MLISSFNAQAQYAISFPNNNGVIYIDTKDEKLYTVDIFYSNNLIETPYYYDKDYEKINELLNPIKGKYTYYFVSCYSKDDKGGIGGREWNGLYQELPKIPKHIKLINFQTINSLVKKEFDSDCNKSSNNVVYSLQFSSGDLFILEKNKGTGLTAKVLMECKAFFIDDFFTKEIKVGFYSDKIAFVFFDGVIFSYQFLNK